MVLFCNVKKIKILKNAPLLKEKCCRSFGRNSMFVTKSIVFNDKVYQQIAENDRLLQ